MVTWELKYVYVVGRKPKQSRGVTSERGDAFRRSARAPLRRGIRAEASGGYRSFPVGSGGSALQAKGTVSAKARLGILLGVVGGQQTVEQSAWGERLPGRALGHWTTPGMIQTLWRALGRGLACSTEGSI